MISLALSIYIMCSCEPPQFHDQNYFESALEEEWRCTNSWKEGSICEGKCEPCSDAGEAFFHDNAPVKIKCQSKTWQILCTCGSACSSECPKEMVYPSEEPCGDCFPDSCVNNIFVDGACNIVEGMPNMMIMVGILLSVIFCAILCCCIYCILCKI